MLVWNVYVGNFNSGLIESHNVFDHWRFLEDCRKNAKKNGGDKDAFAEQLRRDLMYYYWSKCEWEIIIDHWPHCDRFRDEKVDVYDQVRLNWDKFVDYVWQNIGELKKKPCSPKTRRE